MKLLAAFFLFLAVQCIAESVSTSRSLGCAPDDESKSVGQRFGACESIEDCQRKCLASDNADRYCQGPICEAVCNLILGDDGVCARFPILEMCQGRSDIEESVAEKAIRG